MSDALLADALANFHFLRPEWFCALIPALLLFALLRYRQSHHSNWEKVIAPHLLPHLLDNPDKVVSKSPLSLLLVAWLLATVAIAGPVWRQTPQPVHEREACLQPM
jgi:Ca-activated chloride channel family protein